MTTGENKPPVAEPPQAPLVHTAEQASAIIGGTCKASWLKAGARDGRFPHVMIGGAYNFTDAQLREIVDLCTVPARQRAAAAPAAVEPPAAPPPRALPADTGVRPLRARAPRRRPKE